MINRNDTKAKRAVPMEPLFLCFFSCVGIGEGRKRSMARSLPRDEFYETLTL